MSSGYQRDTLISSSMFSCLPAAFLQKPKKKQDEKRESTDKVWRSSRGCRGRDMMGEEFQTDVGSVEE